MLYLQFTRKQKFKNMKKLFIYSLLGLSILAANVKVQAQSAYETKISYMKNDVSGFAADYNISKSELSDVAEAYFKEQLKEKRKKNKDFYMYQGINFLDIFGQEKGDLYYKVEGNKKSSKLILLVSKGYDNFVNGSSDAQIANNTKNFLNNFQKEIDKYLKSKLIEEQKELIKKAEKENKSLLEDQSRIEKKIKDLERELESKKKEISQKGADIEKLKARLEELQKS